MKELLQQVIDGKKKEVHLPFTPIAEIEEALTELGIDTNDVDPNTNGWEIDFWYTYQDRYTLSGSLYMGNMKFEKIK
jgi:hypothetical protein